MLSDEAEVVSPNSVRFLTIRNVYLEEGWTKQFKNLCPVVFINSEL